MPILEHLEVNCSITRWRKSADTIVPLDIPENVLPQLRCLRGGGLQWHLTQPSVNLSLTELVLTRVLRPWPALDFSELLRSVSATLVTLVIVDVRVRGVVPSVPLLRLQALTLENISIEVQMNKGTRAVSAVRAFLDGAKVGTCGPM